MDQLYSPMSLSSRNDYLLVDISLVSSIASMPIYQGLVSNIFVYNLTAGIARISEYYRIRPVDSTADSADIVRPYAMWSRDFGLVIKNNVTVQLERRKNLRGN